MAKSVFSTNFDSSVPAQINPGQASLTGVQLFSGLGPQGNQFANQFLRSATGNVVTLTLQDLPTHTTIDLDFLFAAIDSLDGTGQFPSGDFFKITLDGQQIFRESFANSEPSRIQSYSPPAGVELARRQNLGFSGPGGYYTDSAYNLGADPRFRNIPHTASTATFTFQIEGEGIQSLADESWAMDNLKVSVNAGSAEVKGLVGDVIRIDLNQELEQQNQSLILKSLPDSQKGRLVDEQGRGGVIGSRYSILYYVPNVDGSIGEYGKSKSHRGIGTASFKLQNQQGEDLSIDLDIKDGFSTFSGVNAVKTGNGQLDIYTQEQRLAYLGFPQKNGNALIVDGKDNGNEFGWAADLFDGVVNGVNKIQGGSLPLDNKLSFLGQSVINASNAPRWNEIRIGTIPFLDIFRGNLQTERFGSDWAFKALENAASLYYYVANSSYSNPFTTRLQTNAITIKSGGDNSHTGHETGLEIDIETPGMDTYVVGGNFFKEIEINNISYVAGQEQNSVVVRMPDGTYDDVPQNAIPSNARMLKGSEAFNRENILRDISELIVDNPSVNYDLSLMRSTINTFLNYQPIGVKKIYFNDPRTWDMPNVEFSGWVSTNGNQQGHNGHMHVWIQPPTPIF